MLHEELMKNVHEFPGQQRLPVKPKPADAPIIPQDRWFMQRDANGCTHLTKTYSFMAISERNDFIREILSFEEEFQHCSTMVINEDSVTLTVKTKSIGVTEIDKSFARWADDSYKEATFRVG